MRDSAFSSSSAERMEAVFFRLYSAITLWIQTRMSPTLRSLVEAFTLCNALAMLCILVWFHVKYVTWAADNCVTQMLKQQLDATTTTTTTPPLIRIQISGIWSQLGLEGDSPRMSSFKQTMLHDRDLDMLDAWLRDPTFLFSTERAFLGLDSNKRLDYGLKESFIALNTDQCFAPSSTGQMEYFLLTNFIGWDTVILNSLSCHFARGSLYSLHSREVLALQQPAPSSQSSWFKLTAVLTTLFLFCITTTLVHHMLRETQERMLNFTYELQVLLTTHQPYRALVFNHLMGSLAFVPIMVGMLFFLFEFYNDQLLAFMVLSMVWVCELYSVVCLRTRANLASFPKLFFVYFCAFHLYFFLFPTGFSYIALTCCVTMLQFAMWSFFVHWEMPAYLAGRISAQRRREVGQPSLALQVAANATPVVVVVEETSLSPPSTTATTTPVQEGDDDTTSVLSLVAPPHVLPVLPPPTRRKRSTINTPPDALIMGNGAAGEDAAGTGLLLHLLRTGNGAVTTSSPESVQHFTRSSPSLLPAPPPPHLFLQQQQQQQQLLWAGEVDSQSSNSDWQVGHE